MCTLGNPAQYIGGRGNEVVVVAAQQLQLKLYAQAQGAGGRKRHQAHDLFSDLFSGISPALRSATWTRIGPASSRITIQLIKVSPSPDPKSGKVAPVSSVSRSATLDMGTRAMPSDT